MLQYLKHPEIDFTKWDACLTQASNGLIYGLSWYLEIVSPGWEALVKEEDNRYVAVMPLPVAYKFGIKYLRQPLLTQQLGVFYREPLTQAEWQQVFRLLKKHFRLISNYAFNTGNTADFPRHVSGFELLENINYELPLHKPYREIYAGFYKGRKAVINQAKKQGLILRTSENINKLKTFFEAYTAPKITGFVGETYTYPLMRRVINKAQATGTGILVEVAAADGQVLAMAFFFEFGHRITYLLSTTSMLGKRTGAVSWLLHTLLEKHSTRNVRFDFEAPQPKSPGAVGVVSFYRSFKPEPVTFVSIARNELPLIFRVAKSVRAILYKFVHK